VISFKPYVIGAALVYLVGTPFALDGERYVIDEQVRSGVPGRFASLSAGRTRYDLLGPQPAEVVVFVHGFSSPSYVWGRLPKRLQQEGYRTLVYDLFGRGFSDRPDADYDLDLYDGQLRELMGQLDLDDRVHLVGLSMGGVIASEFALRHPRRVASLTLIDPAGFSVDVPIQARLLALPLVGEYVLKAFGEGVLVSANARGVHDQALVPALQAKFTPQMAYRGYKRAILSSMRNMPLSDFRDRYRELGGSGLPVQIFWGRQDRITPFEGAQVAETLIPQARVHAIDGAGHLAHYEKPDEVVPRIVEFLAAHPAPQQHGAELPGPCGADEAHVHTAPKAVAPPSGAGGGKRSGEKASEKKGSEKKKCRECDPRAQEPDVTDAERARRRALSRRSGE